MQQGRVIQLVLYQNFLKIDQSQVIESAKKGLQSYKEKIIKSIDSIAETDTIKTYQKRK